MPLVRWTAARSLKARLAEIDTPERGQPWATRSKQALSDKVFRERVEVRVVDTDRYGRTVGHVWIGDRHVDREMVRSNRAWGVSSSLRPSSAAVPSRAPTVSALRDWPWTSRRAAVSGSRADPS